MQRTLMLDDLQLADVYRDSGQTGRATDFYLRSMSLAEGLMTGGDAGARRAYVTAARELAVLAMGAGQDNAALTLLDRAVPVAEALALRTGEALSMPERALLPRVYQTLATVHGRLGHTDDAGKWRERARQAWQALSTQPGFSDTLRREMDGRE
jgi:hypothetical protein